MGLKKKKLIIRDIKEIIPDHDSVKISFSAESTSFKPTSLHHIINMSGYFIDTDYNVKIKKKHYYKFVVDDIDRGLMPFKGRAFTATAKYSHHNSTGWGIYDVLPFLWLKTYCFKSRNGCESNVRFLNADMEQLSLFKYACLLFDIKIANKYKWGFRFNDRNVGVITKDGLIFVVTKSWVLIKYILKSVYRGFGCITRGVGRIAIKRKRK